MQTLDSPTPAALRASQVRQVGGAATAARRPIERGALLWTAAAVTAGAALIHLSGAPQQLPRSTMIAAGLALFGLAQLVAAVVVAAIPTRTVLRAAAVFNATSVGIWLIAHNFGLPLGLSIWRPEGLSIPDLILPIFEALAAALLCSVRPRRARHTWRRSLALLPAGLLITVMTAAGVRDALNDAWLSPSMLLNAPAGDHHTDVLHPRR